MIDFNSPTARRAEVFGAAFIILILLGFSIWYMATHQAPEPYALFPDIEEQFHPKAPSGTIEEHEQYYDVSATYPPQTVLVSTAGEEANNEAIAQMETFITETIAQFKKDGGFKNLTPEDVEIMGLSETRKAGISIRYEEHQSPQTVSYVFTISVDTLGAHPNAFYRTFTFAKTDGKLVTLEGLFQPKTEYLKRLSAISEFEVAKNLGEGADVDYIKQGTTPEAGNFENFALDGNKLVIIFAPYHVAPYAAGTQEVSIPFTQLKDILKADLIAE